MQRPGALSGPSPQNFPLKKFLQFLKKKPPALSSLSPQNSPPKKIFIFFPKKSCSEKLSYAFLVFRKPNFHIFRETLAYSEPWYIQNLRHIQNTVKHLRWKVLQKFRTFQSQPQKLFPEKNFPKNPPWKNFLYFLERKLFLHFLKKAPPPLPPEPWYI